MVVERSAEVHIPIEIERMQLKDTEVVADLDKKCFPTPWSLSAYITETHNPSGYYIVAKSGEQVVGYAGMWLIMDEAHITTIGVDPEFRGRKIGERMLVNLLDEALARKARRVTLEVRRHNHVAQSLYNKYLFQTMAVRKGYYSNNNEDAFIMWINDLLDPEFTQTFKSNKEQLEET